MNPCLHGISVRVGKCKGLGIQQGTSIWIGSPKSQWPGLDTHLFALIPTTDIEVKGFWENSGAYIFCGLFISSGLIQPNSGPLMLIQWSNFLEKKRKGKL